MVGRGGVGAGAGGGEFDGRGLEESRKNSENAVCFAENQLAWHRAAKSAAQSRSKTCICVHPGANPRRSTYHDFPMVGIDFFFLIDYGLLSKKTKNTFEVKSTD